MKRLCASALIWWGYTTGGWAGAQTPLPSDLGARLTQRYVSGSMQRFEQASARLAQNLHTWCVSPDAPGQNRVREDFVHTVESWAGIEFLRFGPLSEANRFERIFFWPDPRGVMLRQVQALSGRSGHCSQRRLGTVWPQRGLARTACLGICAVSGRRPAGRKSGPD